MSKSSWNDDNTVGAITSFVVAIVVVIIIVPMTLLRAWVLQTVWGWYITPHFGLAHLRMIDAFGLSIIVSFLTHQVTNKQVEGAKAILLPIFSAIVVLFAAWVGTFWL